MKPGQLTTVAHTDNIIMDSNHLFSSDEESAPDNVNDPVLDDYHVLHFLEEGSTAVVFSGWFDTKKVSSTFSYSLQKFLREQFFSLF